MSLPSFLHLISHLVKYGTNIAGVNKYISRSSISSYIAKTQSTFRYLSIIF